MFGTQTPHQGDALLIVDVQNDFLPGGALAVAEGDVVAEVMNRYIELFDERQLPIYATRDWHPADHCSFQAQGGPWPPHCVANSRGAEFANPLKLPDQGRYVIISKGTSADRDAYSGFAGTDLADRLRRAGVSRVYVGGLATDYCVLNTVRDALAQGFAVLLLEDAIRAVNVQPGDGAQAIAAMQACGAQVTHFAALS